MARSLPQSSALTRPSVLVRTAATLGGLLFVASLLFFVWSFAVRFGADAGPWAPGTGWPPDVLDIALFTAFALHHSLFARAGLKAWIRRVAPPVLERSIYVWIASLLFVVTCWFWQPVPGQVWHTGGLARAMLLTLQLGGVLLTLVAARRLDVLELAGIRQVPRAGDQGDQIRLDDRGPYGLVRHPIYLGWFLIVWLPPTMNGTRLVFAAVSCVYLLAAIPFEERDLRRSFGAAYDAYARRVRWRILPFVY